RDGITLNIDENIKRIHDSVAKGVFDVVLEVERIPSELTNETSLDLGELKLLSTGRSNFTGSPAGRVFNIQKGLSENLNNVIIPPGAEFSFNDLFGSYLSVKDGWKLALGIFNNGELKMTLGAGLCQVSTTLYRAILYAGFPLVERRSHSLYVHYYKEYGEGLDATMYLGGQNLVFKNDSTSYLIMQSYVDGDDAYVKLYGTPDAREVVMDGPYRKANIPPAQVEKFGNSPTSHEIFWFRSWQNLEGERVEEQIVSRYKFLPLE
ncbi:MAG: VanW family protein, partial [bacterium]|nr:VanW family protein [bacterium]